MKHEGSCHCGTIRVAIEGDPVDAGECNCSICRRTGALWTYRSPSQVEVTERWLGKFEQGAKWIVGLKAARMAAEQETI